MNGAAGVVVAPGGRPFSVMGFTVSGGRIVAIDGSPIRPACENSTSPSSTDARSRLRRSKSRVRRACVRPTSEAWSVLTNWSPTCASATPVSAYDEQAYEECLTRSVQEVVAKQRDAGIDIVSDGEYGKSAWNYYVYERLGGIELRPHPVQHADFASVNDAPTDWTRFPEFYGSTSPPSRSSRARAATGRASRP